MDGKLIFIFLLIGFGIFWYMQPDKAHTFLETGVNKTQSMFNNKQPATIGCSDLYSPVCANGKTYSHPCYAQAEGITNWTGGVCP